MISSAAVNCVKTYFKHLMLTHIQGEQEYPILKVLKNETKANESKVASNLGGGSHGHLGLVLTPAEYAMISAVPYVRPLHPGPLTIPTGTTNHEANRLTLAHTEAIRVFRETVEIEKALLNLICAAIDDTYYKERIIPHTNTVIELLSLFITWLFTSYGDIDRDAISEEQKKNLQDPITIFSNLYKTWNS